MTGRDLNEGNLENEEGNIFWVKIEGEKKLATLNLVPGNQVYKEKLVKISDEEFRAWDPFRSKLGAAIMNGLSILPIVRKSKVLYLGVSTGTTASHVSDIVGPSGIVFSVEHTSRVAREFLDRVASYRSNIVPILQDARNPKEYFSVYGIVDVVYVDIAQPDQTEIAIMNCKAYLKKEGYLMLVIKTRSIDVTKDPSEIVRNEIKKLKENFEVIQEINLEPYEKDHSIIIAKFLG
ncbi:MAG TPA: fibrillarin-like rRNA/tRNA 2'-O-methyltransferase [Candidatus Bathyarchaeia archaeon]|nr:fibrillarin-like rRNA/tRNA 2'-O-methyltransferase [Candidatus Bathyarchaeia archaeon]